jgi:hypothetical protein
VVLHCVIVGAFGVSAGGEVVVVVGATVVVVVVVGATVVVVVVGGTVVVVVVVVGGVTLTVIVCVPLVPVFEAASVWVAVIV